MPISASSRVRSSGRWPMIPGFRSFDRNFDRLPERMRWMVEKIVHDPEAPPAPKPEIPDSIQESLRSQFAEDVAALVELVGRVGVAIDADRRARGDCLRCA